MSPTIVMSRDEVDETTLAEIAEVCDISIDHIEDVFACTHLQIASMADSALSARASQYQYVLSLGLSVDTGQLCGAMSQVVMLNAILRTRLVDCKLGLLQIVTNNEHETQCYSSSEDISQYLRREKERPFYLGMPLFRSAIMGRNLVLTVHHAAMDFWSLTPLLGDLMTCYYGRQPEKRPSFKQFVSYCMGIDDSQAKSFWASRFRGTPTIFPKVRPGYVPTVTLKLEKQIKLEHIGTKVLLAQVPTYIEASWALTAGAYSGSDSVAYGLVLSGRSPTLLAGVQTTLGPTIVTIPVQADLRRGLTVEALLKDRSASLRQLQASPALQYGLAKICNLSEAAQSAAAFQTLLNIRSRIETEESKDLEYIYSDDPQPHFALVMSFNFIPNGILLEASSDPDVICEIQLKRILRQFENTLQSMVKADPQTKAEQLQLINAHDYTEILNWNSSIPDPSDRCVHEVFTSQARVHPDALAVEAGDGSATYKKLDEVSNQLARELRRRNVSVGCLVGFMFEKSFWNIVSILAIMKAGGVCIPIEIADPLDRKANIISSAGINIVLTSATGYQDAIKLAPDVIIFTSGSTGTPKGAMLEHRGLVSSLGSIRSRVGWQQGCRVLQFAAHVWDVSIGEIIGTLMFGGCVCIPSFDTRQSNLIGFINLSRIELAWLTPTVLRTISPDEVPGLKMLLCIGEPISSHAAKIWGRALCLFNGWGPCEASVLSAIARLTPDSCYPETIGTPTGCAIWIANAADVNKLAPIGATGELLIEGPGVARGYLNNKAQSAIAFITSPSWAPTRDRPLRRIYRTGDLARYNPDGSLAFVGRRDNQIKVRGQRFELGELENVLSSCEEVKDICAVPQISAGRTELVAVICLEDPELPNQKILQELPESCTERVVQQLRAVREIARSKLPAFMVPTVWLAVEAMPSTASAKLDRVAIRDWLKPKNLSAAKADLDSQLTLMLTLPSTKEERLLQSIWSLILDLPQKNIGLESSFLQLGGDSILAMQVSSRCGKQGYMVRVAALLTASETLASIASEMGQVESRKNETFPYSAKREQETPVTVINRHKSRLSQLHQSNVLFSSENIESLAPATDVQAGMLAVGAIGSDQSYLINFTLDFTPTLDTARLRQACREVVRNHQILRTVFVQHGPSLYQVVLKTLVTDSVVECLDEQKEADDLSEERPLALFRLLIDGQRCRGLRLEIHHALYDALSLELIFRDVDSAYRGSPLSDGPQFCDWIINIRNEDSSAARMFWRDTLKGATMPYIIPQCVGGIRGYPLNESVKINIPLKTLHTSYGTPSSVMKTAWAIVVSQALGTHDVVFGEVSANRYMGMPGVIEVKGPCVNNVPVRVCFEDTCILGSLIKQVHEQSIASLPYHHLEISSLIKDCTSWPPWTRFSSALSYQNHGSLNSSVSIGDAKGVLSIQGNLGDSADIWILATPGAAELEVEVRFSSQILSSRQAKWITQALRDTLEAISSSLDEPLSKFKTSLKASVGSYAASEEPPISSFPDLNTSSHDPSGEVEDIVAKAWAEIGLLPKQTSDDCSMFDRGANIVTALLLSQYYRLLDIEHLGVEQIFRNHNFYSQARLITSKIAVKT
ncbi:putative aminoadipate-semialdehyde dehydrogenase [Xylogone sp. PMI_703]|nr:putative aminoadipate-semialdehyde dehydrogenase [Xylogone sp. PMI_703]